MNTNDIVSIPLDRLIQIATDRGLSGFDVLNLVVTVVLGVLSLALAYFVFRLSQGFETRANGAMDKIASLATEIRQLVQTGLVDQKEMSNKMLDSILSTNFGEKPPATPPGPDETKLIERISALVETKLSSAPSVDRKEIDDLKKAIAQLTRAEVQERKHLVSDQTYRRIGFFAQMPAFVVLLAAIVRKNISSLAQLESIRKAESIPAGAETGIDRLLKEGILLGEPEGFSVNPKFSSDVDLFLKANADVIATLKKQYAARDLDKPDTTREDERATAAQLVF